MSYVVITAASPTHWFVSAPERVTPELLSHLGDSVVVRGCEHIEEYLSALSLEHPKIVVDASTLNWRMYKALQATPSSSAVIIDNRSSVNLAKSIKNDIELDGFRKCHIRDGAALTAYFCWLEQKMEAAKQGQEEFPTEYAVAQKLEEFRGKMEYHVSPSFDTISSYGANGMIDACDWLVIRTLLIIIIRGCATVGAIIHYKPSEATCATLGTESLYLCDSGAQYLDGTTDVTRYVSMPVASTNIIV